MNRHEFRTYMNQVAIRKEMERRAAREQKPTATDIYSVTFTNLTNARNFVARSTRNLFIFAAPTSGYIVVDARTANQLWADGHDNVK